MQYRATLATLLITATLCLHAGIARADEGDNGTSNNGTSSGDERNVMLGVGWASLPAWPGAADQRDRPVPFVQADLPWHATLSTVNGLTVDLLHDGDMHGGFYGNFQWGRDSRQLEQPLAGIVNPLSPRLLAGGYMEYQVSVPFDVGSNLSHDINGAGAHLNVYAEYDLPQIGYFMHSLQLQWQGMNGAGMRRFFSLTPVQADKLGVSPWSPDAGSEEATLEYDAFMPTSLHTGVVAGANVGRLLAQAAGSPLVSRYGSATQLTTMLAFVYRL